MDDLAVNGMTPDASVIALLSAIALVAGTVDGIAGGGGLLTLPALLAAGLDPHAALATNKGQSAFGSTASLIRFARSPLLDRRRAVPGAIAGGLAAAAGTLTVLQVPNGPLRAAVLIALAIAAVLVAIRRDLPDAAPIARPLWLAVLVAAAIGFYDGFFGPGTGTFLIVAYAWLWRDGLAAASANAKAVNWASNVGALAVFAALGAVDWRLALPMGVCQAAGGWIGAHLVVRRGVGLVRWVAIAACLAMVARLAWQLAVGA